MENQNEQQNTPMTDDELDLFIQDISRQVEDQPPEQPEATPGMPPVRRRKSGNAANRSRKRKANQESSDQPQNAKKSRRVLNLLWLLLVLIFAAVFIISATYYFKYKRESIQRQKEDQQMASIVESIQNAQPSQPAPTAPAPVPTYPGGLPINPPTRPTVQEILPEYQHLFDQNPDLVGWIKVPDTKINYPVLQSGLDNKNYYIDHDFYHRARGSGAIYVRESCDVFDPSDNVTIYGHHMKDGTMFAGLDKYIDKSFWETHQIITFDNIFEHHTYQVFAIFVTTANVGEGFSFHQFEYAADEKEFDLFVETVKTLALYDTGITPEYGDKLICLSTCAADNDRLVVVAKRVS